MRQSRQNCKIFGQARRPAPTKACRGDSLWSPGFKKFDFDAALAAMCWSLKFSFVYVIISSYNSFLLEIFLEKSLRRPRNNHMVDKFKESQETPVCDILTREAAIV